MRVVVLALCLAAGAVLVPAGAFADEPGCVQQSNSNAQLTAVDNRGAQSAGLIAGPIVLPINLGLGLNASAGRGHCAQQSNDNSQTTVVDNRGAQSAGLIAGPIVLPINLGLGGNLGLGL